MNSVLKGLFLLGVCLAVPFAAPSARAAAADQADFDVNLQINDQPVIFPDAQPFVDDHYRTQVPIRFVSQQLGYTVDWKEDGPQVEVTLKKGDKQIHLRTGDQEALVNNQKVTLDTNASLIQDRTYVPVRFVSEVIGYSVDWNDANSVAIISTDGAKHHPLSFPRKVNPVDETRLNVISTAKKYLGVPYAWGGTTPSGFDCSGFVGFVLRQNGIEVSRTAAEMYASNGRYTSHLQPGDLVFFSTYNSGASHVGIYLGNNQFISASSSHGVHIDSFSSSYWGPRYLGAKSEF